MITECKNSVRKPMKYKILSRFPALAYKNYRYFLFGQFVSLMGTWIQKTAQQWVVYQLTKSPFILGLVGVFQFTPMLLLSLFAGVLADRFPKKKFLMITQSVQMLQAFALAILLWSGYVKYWHVLILAGILGIANTFDMPTRQSFFIELVGKDALVSAIGLNSTIANMARIIGPTFAAVILSYFGADICFFINGVSFIAVLIGLFKIKTYSANVRERENNIFYEIKEGLKYVFSSKVLTNGIISMLIIGTIAMNSEIIIPVFVKETLHMEVGGYSLLLSAMGVGSLLGSIFFTANKESNISSDKILKYGILLGLFLIITGLFPNYYLSLFSVAAIGGFSMILMASINSLIQLNSVDEFRGRAMSLYSLVLMGTTPIGNFFTGIIDERSGPNVSFIINGGLTAVLMLMLFTLTNRSKKSLNKKFKEEWSMSIKVAVGSSNGITIDQHFGSGDKFYIFELSSDGSSNYIDTIEIKDEDIDREKEKISLEESNVNVTSGGCGSGSGGGCGSGAGGGCGSGSGGGCGSGSVGYDNSDLIAKIKLLSPYDAVLVSKIGNKAEKLLIFSGLQAFENDGLIEKALTKLSIYFKRTKAF